MRVLHVTTTVGTGGAERMLLNVVSAGRNTGVSHGVVALRRGGMLTQDLRDAGAEVWNCDLRAGELSVRAGLEIRRIAARFAPDALQGWMYHGNLAACWAQSRWRRVPVVWGIHHSIDDLRNEKRLTRMLVRGGALLSRWPRRIVYVSRASREQHRALGYHDAYSSVIPNGFDCERFRPRPGANDALREALGIGPEPFVFGKVAVVRPMKDHANLLRAAALLERRGLPFHIVLIGQRTTSDNPDLMRMIGEAGIGDRISLLGECHNMPELMAGLDGLVVSSAWGEAFPIVLGEAMASGIPCITTDVGDSAWLVGESGIVVPPRDPEALAGAMAGLIAATKDERRRRGLQARARIEAQFELGGVVRRYDALYEQLANGATGAVRMRTP